jgi:hypothetical protein
MLGSAGGGVPFGLPALAGPAVFAVAALAGRGPGGLLDGVLDLLAP